MTPALKRLCEVTSALSSRIRKELLKLPSDKPEKSVTLFWFAKAAKSYEAALLLWEQGYWQDAAVIGRTIQEVALQAMYFRKDPAAFAQRFFEHRQNQRIVLFKDLKEFADADTYSAIEAIFQNENIEQSSVKRHKNWWGKDESIWDLVEEIDAQQIYRSQYGPLSTLVHGSPLALEYYIFNSGNAAGIDWEANLPRQPDIIARTMLSAAPAGLLDVIVVLAEVWNLDFDSDLQEAFEAATAYKEEKG